MNIKQMLFLISHVLLFVSCANSDKGGTVIWQNYLDQPNEENFLQICLYGEKSSDPKYKIVYYYSVVSQEMTPSDDPSPDNLEQAQTYLKEHSSLVGEALHKIILKHEDPWRRWTAAKVVGEFADQKAIPMLEICLREELNTDVTYYLNESISRIKARKQE